MAKSNKYVIYLKAYVVSKDSNIFVKKLNKIVSVNTKGIILMQGKTQNKRIVISNVKDIFTSNKINFQKAFIYLS